MKRRALCAVFAVLAAVLLAGCGAKSTRFWPENAPKHGYRMDLTFDEAQKTLSGELLVRYINPTGAPLSHAPFLVYPNAFEISGHAPFYADYAQTAYPNGFSPGSLSLSALSVDGVDAAYEIGNEDRTLLRVVLPAPLAPGGEADIAFSFTVKIPNSLGRFGYGERAVNLCNFYPIACAYDGEKFLTYPYIERGDPFVSDIADYEVTLRVPSGLTAAHTGTAQMTAADGVDTYVITAPNVRDFAAVLSRDFVVNTKRVKANGADVIVSAYTYADAAYGKDEAVVYGADAAKAFSRLVGPYPYPTLCVVQTDFFIGGMEYPGIVLIDRSLYTHEAADMLEYVIVHEVGHQWFYGVVGNDQVMEPWLDEALTEYITLCYYGHRYGEAAQQEQYRQSAEFPYLMGKAYGLVEQAHDRVGLPTTSFPSDFSYSAVVYNRGAMMFSALAQEIGQKKLLGALGVYYHEYAGRRATKDDLLQVLDRETGFDCTGFLNDWL